VSTTNKLEQTRSPLACNQPSATIPELVRADANVSQPVHDEAVVPNHTTAFRTVFPYSTVLPPHPHDSNRVRDSGGGLFETTPER